MAESDKASAPEIRDKRSCRAVKHFFWPCSLSSSEDSSQGYSEKSTAAQRAHNDWGTTAILNSTRGLELKLRPTNQFTSGETASPSHSLGHFQTDPDQSYGNTVAHPTNGLWHCTSNFQTSAYH